MGRSHRTNDALVLRDLKKEDAGIHVCVGTSAGVFAVEAICDVEVLARAKGKVINCVVPFCPKLRVGVR